VEKAKISATTAVSPTTEKDTDKRVREGNIVGDKGSKGNA
jgi:hypothetical protein